SKNEAMITACEKNKIRAERLKYNLDKQGARANVMMQDARKLDNFFSFDKVLLDSPCSGSGTNNVFEEKFTKELVERSANLQEELLKKALCILKPGGEIVYSTCSILKTENEQILNKILKKENSEIIPIDKEKFKGIPLLPSLIEGTICVAPNELYEGFFIAKIRRRK
ncbi:MAG: RsmB/NOP family class I SAM-dependent RNA methyltransferase, partial [Clostridia bacterium]|nr:RsmB/NOP family class I SAM-dependent RNA methyltransferase [Clostridia bacterium]